MAGVLSSGHSFGITIGSHDGGIAYTSVLAGLGMFDAIDFGNTIHGCNVCVSFCSVAFLVGFVYGLDVRVEASISLYSQSYQTR